MIINHKPQHHKDIAIKACKNLGLTKRETKLFLYYESCKTGFHPALMQIENETGIATNKISEKRKKLHDKCLIRYCNEKRSIVILWLAVTNYANEIFPANGYGYYTPDDYSYYLVPLEKLESFSRKNISNVDLSSTQCYFLNFLGGLTWYEYELLLSTFPEKKSAPYRTGAFFVYGDETQEQLFKPNFLLNSDDHKSEIVNSPYVFPEIDNPLPF